MLERFVARLRERVEAHLWARLGAHLTEEQQGQLEALLRIPEGAEYSALDDLRNGPFTISAPALVRALKRLKSVRSLGIVIPLLASIPPSRIALLARFADKAKASAAMRLPKARRLATLAAFIYALEASAQDDAIELLEVLLAKMFGEAEKKDKKARMRTLKDIDALAVILAEVCQVVVDPGTPDERIRVAVLALIPRDAVIQTLRDIGELVRPLRNPADIDIN